jgi:hypothetical protein
MRLTGYALMGIMRWVVVSTARSVVFRLGLKERAAQSLLSPSDEDLVEGLDRQTMNLFGLELSLHLAGFLSG